jgi:peptidoglycan/LPS O-acetylase OafA/YrhL
MNRRAMIIATSVGLALQLAMVIVGHFASASFRQTAFAVGGMGFSLIAGAIYARLAKRGWAGTLGASAIVGGLCALAGIAVSVALKDVPASLLALGTIASIITGVAGGALGRFIPKRTPPSI